MINRGEIWEIVDTRPSPRPVQPLVSRHGRKMKGFSKCPAVLAGRFGVIVKSHSTHLCNVAANVPAVHRREPHAG